MKKLLIVFIIYGLTGIGALYSQSAEIYFLRPRAYVGAAMNMQIFMDGQKVGVLAFGDRLIYRTSDIGGHELTFRMLNAKAKLNIQLESGGVYFIETNMALTRLKAEILEPSIGRALFENETVYRKDGRIIRVDANSQYADTEFRLEEKEKPAIVENIEVSDSDFSPHTEISQKRIALVIGNGDYTHGGYLRNPLNDAEDMSNVLKKLGFEVMLVKNADLVKLKSVIDEFGLKLGNYDVGLFYYAGHGLQSKGFNYFIPVDADLKTEAQVEFNCVRTDRLLSLMESASNKTNIIILDACRNNPFERSWSRSANGAGLAFMDAPSGSLIAYATSPGRTASDGYGRNGLYTSALLEHITKPDISIEQMFKKVRETVSQKSGQAQIPWESTSLLGNFYFVSPQN